jgi:hypothetical protein
MYNHLDNCGLYSIIYLNYDFENSLSFTTGEALSWQHVSHEQYYSDCHTIEHTYNLGSWHPSAKFEHNRITKEFVFKYDLPLKNFHVIKPKSNMIMSLIKNLLTPFSWTATG